MPSTNTLSRLPPLTWKVKRLGGGEGDGGFPRTSSNSGSAMWGPHPLPGTSSHESTPTRVPNKPDPSPQRTAGPPSAAPHSEAPDFLQTPLSVPPPPRWLPCLPLYPAHRAAWAWLAPSPLGPPAPAQRGISAARGRSRCCRGSARCWGSGVAPPRPPQRASSSALDPGTHSRGAGPPPAHQELGESRFSGSGAQPYPFPGGKLRREVRAQSAEEMRD